MRNHKSHISEKVSPAEAAKKGPQYRIEHQKSSYTVDDVVRATSYGSSFGVAKMMYEIAKSQGFMTNPKYPTISENIFDMVCTEFAVKTLRPSTKREIIKREIARTAQIARVVEIFSGSAKKDAPRWISDYIEANQKEAYTVADVLVITRRSADTVVLRVVKEKAQKYGIEVKKGRKIRFPQEVFIEIITTLGRIDSSPNAVIKSLTHERVPTVVYPLWLTRYMMDHKQMSYRMTDIARATNHKKINAQFSERILLLAKNYGIDIQQAELRFDLETFLRLSMDIGLANERFALRKPGDRISKNTTGLHPSEDSAEIVVFEMPMIAEQKGEALVVHHEDQKVIVDDALMGDDILKNVSRQKEKKVIAQKPKEKRGKNPTPKGIENVVASKQEQEIILNEKKVEPANLLREVTIFPPESQFIGNIYPMWLTRYFIEHRKNVYSPADVPRAIDSGRFTQEKVKKMLDLVQQKYGVDITQRPICFNEEIFARLCIDMAVKNKQQRISSRRTEANPGKKNRKEAENSEVVIFMEAEPNLEEAVPEDSIQINDEDVWALGVSLRNYIGRFESHTLSLHVQLAQRSRGISSVTDDLLKKFRSSQEGIPNLTEALRVVVEKMRLLGKVDQKLILKQKSQYVREMMGYLSGLSEETLRLVLDEIEKAA